MAITGILVRRGWSEDMVWVPRRDPGVHPPGVSL